RPYGSTRVDPSSTRVDPASGSRPQGGNARKEPTAVNEVFGMPMSSTMIVLLVGLSLALLTVAWVAWRRPVLFKLGVRNIPRRRAQSTLIVVGLMLSTLIMSAAL